MDIHPILLYMLICTGIMILLLRVVLRVFRTYFNPFYMFSRTLIRFTCRTVVAVIRYTLSGSENRTRRPLRGTQRTLPRRRR